MVVQRILVIKIIVKASISLRAVLWHVYPFFLEWTVPYVKEGGYVVALKGAIYEEEVGESNKALSTLKANIEEVHIVYSANLG